MPYLVKVVGADDSISSLLLEAENSSTASARARADGYVVLGVRKQSPWGLARAKRGPKFSTLMFSQELLALLSAGLSLVEALEALKSKRQYQGHGIVESLSKALAEGQPFSAAVSRYPDHFSSLYVASVQASERTGNLPEALRRFIAYQEQMDGIRKKLVSASMYPALISAVGVLVMLFLLLYVVPRFSKVYETFSGELPFFSRMLVGLGGFVSDNGWLVTTGLIAIVAAVVAAFRLPATRRRLADAVRRFPIIAENARLYELSRLYRTLGMLLRGGVPITRALTMAAPLLGAGGQHQVEQANRLVSEGRPLSSAMVTTALTTGVAHRMLMVGERTGSMGEMMERIAAFHEQDLARWIEDFSKLFEPVLMLILGVLVGGIVVVMYMPIFELATAIQ